MYFHLAIFFHDFGVGYLDTKQMGGYLEIDKIVKSIIEE